MDSDYDKIAAIIKWLEQQDVANISLAQVAQHIGQSSSYTHRLFKRWAGLSPKQFTQYRNMLAAEHFLTNGHSVLDTTLETGLSSPGRLHDQMLSINAITPGTLRNGGQELRIYYGIHNSPFGYMFIAETTRGIMKISFIDQAHDQHDLHALNKRFPQAQLLSDQKQTAQTLSTLFGSFAKNKRTAIQFCVSGTNFQIKVWEALLSIPYGQTSTYAAIANAIGKPNAARAVGTAVGQNPIAYFIPCHRVLRKDRLIGAYRWGSTRKKSMLIKEHFDCQ